MRKDGNTGRNGRFDSQPGSEFMALGTFAPPSVEVALRASNVWMKGVGSLNEEMLSFSQEQLGKYMEAGQSLLRCSSLEQAITAQCDIARNTLESCYREANKLIALSSDIAREALAQDTAAKGGEPAAAAGAD